MIILPAQLSELTRSSKANSTGSSLASSSPVSTQTRQTSNKDTINHVQGSSDMMQWWYAMRDAMQDAKWKIWQQMHEPVLNLEFQGCHWKEGMKSLENDIKNAGIGVTVWECQAIQKWHRSTIYSKWPSKCNEMNMLQHPNMTTKYMAGMHSRCLTKV